ncbi:MAG: hypothetical protein WAO58_04290 [Fimbriimonadaceae bacterium]
MQVQEFECQIAQAQIARYLAGDPFDPESLKQLNGHVAACEACKSAIDKRRTQLQGTISEPDAPAPLSAAVAGWSRHSKTGIYLGALALVLGAMSFVANDPTSIFGQRAAVPTVEVQPETASLFTPKQSTPPAAEPEDAGNEPVKVAADSLSPTKPDNPKGLDGPVGSINKDGVPDITVYPPSSAIAKAVSGKKQAPVVKYRPAVKRTPKKISTPAPRPSSGIVIYDSGGNVIRPEGN